MLPLNSDFDELRAKIQNGRDFGHASFEPIYYLVFHPSQIIEVKRQIPAWKVKLRNDGWNVFVFSFQEEIKSILTSDMRWEMWRKFDRKNPLNWEPTNQAIRNALTGGEQPESSELQQRLEKLLSSLEGQKDALVFVTDLEALHPYLRVGAIESLLQGKFHVPTIFFYPGTRNGKTNLNFLGFYPEDGNYRSVHIGG